MFSSGKAHKYDLDFIQHVEIINFLISHLIKGVESLVRLAAKKKNK